MTLIQLIILVFIVSVVLLIGLVVLAIKTAPSQEEIAQRIKDYEEDKFGG